MRVGGQGRLCLLSRWVRAMGQMSSSWGGVKVRCSPLPLLSLIDDVIRYSRVRDFVICFFALASRYIAWTRAIG